MLIPAELDESLDLLLDESVVRDLDRSVVLLFVDSCEAVAVTDPVGISPMKPTEVETDVPYVLDCVKDEPVVFVFWIEFTEPSLVVPDWPCWTAVLTVCGS